MFTWMPTRCATSWRSPRVTVIATSQRGSPTPRPACVGALGLRWSEDLDLTSGAAYVVQTLICINHKAMFSTSKTNAGQRRIEIDRATVAVLKDHRRRQLEDRLLVGDAWQANDLVFAKADGSPLQPEGFSREFDRRLKRWGLAKITAFAQHYRSRSRTTTTTTTTLKPYSTHLEKSPTTSCRHPSAVQERLGHTVTSASRWRSTRTSLRRCRRTARSGWRGCS